MGRDLGSLLNSFKRNSQKKEKRDDKRIIREESDSSSTTDEENYPGGNRRKRLHEKRKQNGTTIIIEEVGENRDLLSNSSPDFGIESGSSSLDSILSGNRERGNTEKKNLYRSASAVVATVEDSESLLHTVTGKETLQGIALKYGVQVSDIKRANNLWTNEDIFGRKHLIIPISPEAYLEYQAKHPQSSRPKPNIRDLDLRKKQELIKKFTEIAHCEPELAKIYLEEKNWDFTRALGLYYSQQEQGDGQQESLREKMRKKLKEEEEEDYEADQEYKKKSSYNIGNIEHNPTPVLLSSKSKKSPFGVGRVNKRTQEQLNHHQEELFEI